jgi:hypothetical protein
MHQNQLFKYYEKVLMVILNGVLGSGDNCISCYAVKYRDALLFDRVSAYTKSLLCIASLDQNVEFVKSINENFQEEFNHYHQFIPGDLNLAVMATLTKTIVSSLFKVCFDALFRFVFLLARCLLIFWIVPKEMNQLQTD